MDNNKVFTTRRGSSSTSSVSWSRNRNLVSESQKRGIGKMSYTVIVGMLTLIFGLIYVSAGTKATSYDYQISEIEGQIVEMQAKKEDLAVEQARLTSIAKAKTSEVAAVMEDTTTTGYVSE